MRLSVYGCPPVCPLASVYPHHLHALSVCLSVCIRQEGHFTELKRGPIIGDPARQDYLLPHACCGTK